jgi:hypothetical protein
MMHGHNAFMWGDRIFRTYFTDARGDEHLGTTWSYLASPFRPPEEEIPDGYRIPGYQWWNYHARTARTYDRHVGGARRRRGDMTFDGPCPPSMATLSQVRTKPSRPIGHGGMALHIASRR